MNNKIQICKGAFRDGRACGRVAKLNEFCKIHSPLKPIKCYNEIWDYKIDDIRRCNERCEKGKIFCSGCSKGEDAFICFGWRLSVFSECITSTAFYNAIEPFYSCEERTWEYREVAEDELPIYPLRRRLRTTQFSDEAKIAIIDADLIEAMRLLKDYIDFVKVAYPTEYYAEGHRLRRMEKDIITELKFQREVKRISFIALGMDGTREVITTTIYPETAIYDIKRHIIAICHNKSPSIYNVALFRIGCEDEIEVWTDELMNTEIFVLMSAETARPLILGSGSFKEGDLLKYTHSWKPYNITYYKVLYGGSWLDTTEVKYTTDDNGNNIVDWDGPNYGYCQIKLRNDMNITCSRWSDDPAFNTE